MIITYLGNACFKLKGKNTVLITDPCNKAMAKTHADIVTISNKHHDYNLEKITGNPFVIRGPGEYEIKEIGISGVHGGANTIYLYNFDDLQICHLGSLTEKLSDKQVEQLDGIDILFIPVDTIDGRQALDVIEQLEPKIVIPMLFETLENFLKEIGEKDLKPVDKLNVNPSTLPEERGVIWLKK